MRGSLLLLSLLAGAGAAHSPLHETYCRQLDDRYPGGERAGAVSAGGRGRRVALVWGAAPARAGAALLAALLAAALRLRVRLARAPHRLVRLAADTSSIQYRADADYDEMALVVSAAWSGEAGARCTMSDEDECGVAGRRLREFGAAPVPAHARLLARLAPAAPARCARAARWDFYTNTTSLTECHFLRETDVGGATPVYYPDEEALQEFVDELRQRAHAASLPLHPQRLPRGDLFKKLRSTNDSFLFLDFDIWYGEPGVRPVASPPCAEVEFECREELDPSVALRAVDSNLLTRYAPRLYDAFHRFAPTLSSLRQVLEDEARNHTVEEAACKWAIENNVSFTALMNRTMRGDERAAYEELVFVCEGDGDADEYHALINMTYWMHLQHITLGNYEFNVTVMRIDCADPKVAITKFDKVMGSVEGKRVMGLVAGGEGVGGELAAFAAHHHVPLLLYEPPAESIDAAGSRRAPAWSSVGRLRPLALVLHYLAEELRWTRLAVVSDPTPFSRDYFDALNDRTLSPDLSLRDHPVRADVSPREATALLETLRAAHARVVFVNARADTAAAVLAAAAASGMTGDEYAWLVRDWPPGNGSSDAQVISISYWCRGSCGAGNESGLPELRAAMDRRWGPRGWPARAAALADALLTLAYGFQDALRNHSSASEYDLHTDQITAAFKSAMAERWTGRAGVLQELSYEASTRARAQPLVFVERWRGAARTPLGRCRMEGARPRCELLPLYPDGAPADGAAPCAARVGDAFEPTCLDAAWISALAAAALAAPAAYAARRAVLRRLARRDRRVLLQLLARRERAASALAAHLAPRSALELRQELGAGRFGRVHLALLRAGGRACVVAAKSLREGAAPAEESEFLREACTLAALEHEHVVRLVGVCADDGPPLVLMEHAFFGDLLHYLRARRHLAEAATDGAAEAAHVSAEALTRLAREAASALSYLALRGLVHRDVRAANCLVDARRSLKLADFGMARETAAAGADGAAEYACRRRALFPVLWMAPESLARGVFSAASDVWALGVLLLELVTLGERPYGDMSPLRVLQYVAAGGRPPLPPDTTPQTRGVALACWQRAAEQRPAAPELVSYLAAHPRALRPALRPPRLEPTDADSGFGEPASPKPASPEPLPSDSCLEVLDCAPR